MAINQKTLVIVAVLFLVGMVIYGFWPANPSTTGPNSHSSSPQDVTSRNLVTGSASSPTQGDNISSNLASSVNPLSRPTLLPVVWNNLPASTKIIQYPTNALQTGTAAQALVHVGNQAFELAPNQMGQFDQITVGPKSTISVQVAYPDNQPGDTVALQAEDGGIIDGKGIAKVVQLDGNRQIAFNFAVNQEEGIYRVAARQGGDTKTLAFWVSEDK